MKAWLLTRLKEPSTKRGIVWLLAGIAVLCGYELDPERIERWIGAAMFIAGLMGWLPDAKQELPPIELQGRVAADPNGPSVVNGPAGIERMQRMQPDYQPKEPTQPVDLHNGWNG